MGNIDKLTTKFMNHNDVFADAFNFFIYNGEKIIDASTLKPMDSHILLDIFDWDKPKQSYKTVQKYRDVFKQAVIKYDDEAAYVLLGVENQTDIHYAMPVRNMIYDALSYAEQVSARGYYNKKNKTAKDGVEFLSGFLKTDKLIPVITLVVYFGVEKWDGPISLHEMLDTNNDVVLKYIQDYRINLIEPSGIKEEELELFTSDLKEVLTFIKFSKDSEKIKEHYMDRGKVMIDNDAIRVIETVTNIKVPKKKGRKKTDMCEAINKLIEEEVSTIKKIAQERTAEEVNKIKEEAAREKNKIKEEAEKEKKKIEEEAAKEKRKVEEEAVKVKEEAAKVKEEAAKEIEKILEESNKIREENAQKIDDAIIETNIRYVLKGKISIEEAAEDCGLTVEDFSKKKEEYCENRGISSK
ncbi:MAG: Rpn family recombination-promoting nuclease/putative transposase [Solobacterium sp.]|nr:Rpn family recombination-promoting nuclease/putative transposase [Solobacterium sp.]